MYVSGREVAALLGLGRETAQRLLASGLVGEPLAHVRRACPDGIVVGRVDPRRTTSEGPWRVSRVVQAMTTLMVRSRGYVPLVVTVGSFVLSCHEVVGCVAAGAGRPGLSVRLELRAPGDWSRSFDERLLFTPPGHPLLFWACEALPPIRRAGCRAAAG